MHSKPLYLMFVAAAVLMGCDNLREPLDPTASEIERIAPAASVGAGEWAIGPFAWLQGQASIALRPSSTHLCILTKVQGKFAGGGEYVRVEADADGFWRLRGGSQQSGVAAEAYCFETTAFIANGSARWISPQFMATDVTSGCAGNSAATWWGDAATMLSGISGEFEGGGERGRVSQSPGLFTNSAVIAESCQGWMQVRAYSFFAGSPHVGQIPKFHGGEYFATLYSSDVAVSQREARLAPVGDAMCYLSRVEGDFGGGAERVRIFQKLYNGIPYWYIEVTGGKLSGGDRRHMRGGARCYKRSQL